jgi:hypothetical protein
MYLASIGHLFMKLYSDMMRNLKNTWNRNLDACKPSALSTRVPMLGEIKSNSGLYTPCCNLQMAISLLMFGFNRPSIYETSFRHDEEQKKHIKFIIEPICSVL